MCFGNHATPRGVDFNRQQRAVRHALVRPGALRHRDRPARGAEPRGSGASGDHRSRVSTPRNYQAVQRVLETGVGGIMCAMVEQAEEAAQIVRWAKFNNPRSGGRRDHRPARLERWRHRCPLRHRAGRGLRRSPEPRDAHPLPDRDRGRLEESRCHHRDARRGRNFLRARRLCASHRSSWPDRAR